MTNKLHKNITEIWEDEYVVPLYQRNFAWREEQIRQLLQDIYDHHKSDDNYYLGSLVVLQRNDGRHEVIDGQQRLTALQIICKDLGITHRPCLHFDSRPEVEDFLHVLYNSPTCDDCLKTYQSKDNPKIVRLIEALGIVSATLVRTFSGEEVSFGELPQNIRQDIAGFLKHRVILLCVPLPSDTDVAAYFEIMNNRGRQLQPHEVIKAMILGNDTLTANQRSIFATIWDACSQMNVPIQRSLAALHRNGFAEQLFGPDYNSLNVEVLTKDDSSKEENKIESTKSIDEILSQGLTETSNLNDQTDEYRYSSIIDFSNFLTHIFKLYDEGIELNGDKLQDAYTKVSPRIQPMEFITTLLTARTMFDRYVVKVMAENEEDEDIQWVMQRPYLRGERGYTRLDFKNTFSQNAEADDNEIEGNAQKRIVKQLSLLQVSFRNRKYKNWLFDYLKWLMADYRYDIASVSSQQIITHLDCWMEQYFEDKIKNSYKDKEGNDALYRLGVGTPHFLFNFIDYLYWLEKTEGNSLMRYVDEVRDFKFRYYNSVEHHRAQSYNNEDIDCDMIGNLCLISRRNNSSLNDKDPREKIQGNSDNLQPKRRIMYHITNIENDWTRKQILDHHKDITQLIDGRKRVLRLGND